MDLVNSVGKYRRRNWPAASGYLLTTEQAKMPKSRKPVEARLKNINWIVDVVLTHTCLLKYEPTEVFLPFIDQSGVDNKPLDERIGSTIRHNRARGTHQIRPMSEIVISLAKMGWSDEKISTNLGMELDEIMRLKQISGLKEAFQNHEFSKSWEEFEHKYYR